MTVRADDDDLLLLLSHETLKAGIDPDDAEQLTWAASAGAYLAWVRRDDDLIWESRHHSKGKLTDGQNMRANAQGTRIIYTVLTGGGTFADAARAVTDPERVLLDGRRLVEVTDR